MINFDINNFIDRADPLLNEKLEVLTWWSGVLASQPWLQQKQMNFDAIEEFYIAASETLNDEER